MSRDTKRLLKKRNKAWSAYARNKCVKLYNTYKTIRNEVVTNIRKDKAQYQKKLVKRMKNSPKMFYSYVQSNQKNVVSVGKVCNADGKISEDDKEAAIRLFEPV